CSGGYSRNWDGQIGLAYLANWSLLWGHTRANFLKWATYSCGTPKRGGVRHYGTVKPTCTHRTPPFESAGSQIGIYDYRHQIALFVTALLPSQYSSTAGIENSEDDGVWRRQLCAPFTKPVTIQPRAARALNITGTVRDV